MSCLLLQIVILLKKIFSKNRDNYKALKLFKYLKLLNLTYFMF